MQIAGMISWWLLITFLGVITIPITYVLFPQLNDRGYSFSKPLGLLVVGYLSWLIGFLNFSNLTIMAVMLTIAGLSVWIYLRHRSGLHEWVSNHLGLILIIELFFLLLYLLFLFFRMYNADILGTEKFMDLAFLNAISRTPTMPPYDPWLSGEGFHISYYYFGYLLMALLVKLTGIAPAIGFNLSLALLYALSGLAVFGVLYNLVKRISVAIGGWAFIYLIGNLDGFKQVLTTQTISNFNWWTPSRVIADTINEFPFFSYLLGDMHPHMLAVPFVMLTLAMALNHLKSENREIMPNNWPRLLTYLIWGWLIGALGFINSWDMPSMLFMAGLCLFFQQYRLYSDIRQMNWKAILSVLGILIAAAIIPYLLFYLNFNSQAKGLALTTQNTKISDFLLIFGPYMFVVLTFLAVRYHAWFIAIIHPAATQPNQAAQRQVGFCGQCGSKLRAGKSICGQCGYQVPLQPSGGQAAKSPLARPLAELPDHARQTFLFILQPFLFWRQHASKKVAWSIIAAVVVIAGMMLIKALTYGQADGNPAPLMMGLTLLLLLSVVLLLTTKIEAAETVFVYCLLATGFLLLFGCEFLHINDTFEPPLDRMNTVFKFYYLTWFLLGLSAVTGLTWSVRYSFENHHLKMGWTIILILLILASLVYPYAGTLIKTNHFNNPTTLDGSRYLKNSYAPDRDGIEWLRYHVTGNPVVLEATGGQYTDFARVSSFTGLPTVLGWAGHELQWRGNYDEPGQRIPVIEEIYSTRDANKAKQLLNRYDVEFVFVGTLEKDKYAAEALEKFSGFMKLVYKNDGVKIYQRK